jgi:uncharacterized membrane protein
MNFPLWAIFALSAAIFWAVTNIIDKIIVTDHLSYKQIFMFAPFKLVLAIPMFFLFDLTFSWLSFVVFLGGGLAGFSVIFYYLGLREGEVTRLTPLFATTPVITALLSAIFLSEILPVSSYFGVIFLVGGAILISYEKSRKEKFNKKPIAFFLLSIFLYAIMNIITKYFLGYIDSYSFFFFYFIGSSLFLPLVFCITEDKQEFFAKIKTRKILTLLIFSSILPFLGFIFHFMSLSIGFVTLVSALEEIQAFFVLVIVTVITAFSTKIVKEKTSGFIFLQKLIAIALLLVGVFIII